MAHLLKSIFRAGVAILTGVLTEHSSGAFQTRTFTGGGLFP